MAVIPTTNSYLQSEWKKEKTSELPLFGFLEKKCAYNSEQGINVITAWLFKPKIYAYKIVQTEGVYIRNTTFDNF